eukprot:CAMPEP_0178401268 /NCGR_PEP_ID=MMETSP0689_2-20121128/16213_1 /TAXON_ID=160604 /ORGANISM="Amphidinium massartii, Strain CS-259" /LENGTH=744 /DNA_ID=CAMNT_0020022081 /DNA_START=188 /DNA_END=2422 /DNA_ORIENTATION=+
MSLEDASEAPPASFLEVLVVRLWDYGVPLLTWLVALLFFLVPRNVRCLVLAVWLLPVVMGSRLNGSQWWLKMMQRIAALKGLRVSSGAGAGAAMPVDTTSSCIFGFHPHGSFPVGILPWMASRPDVFAKTVLAQSSAGSWFPSMGYVTMMSNVVSATRQAMTKALAKGSQVAVFPGGLKEGVACEPFSSEIALVKHDGFLRLARRTAVERREQGQEGPTVVPCFLFGMHDWYASVLPGVSKFLYKKTGMLTLPLWWLQREGDRASKLMVVGSPLDPLAYDTDEELVEAYYQQVVELFEAHKARVPGYEHRSISMLAPTQKPSKQDQSKAPKKKGGKNVTGMVYFLVSAVFLAIVAGSWLINGTTARLSYGSAFPKALESTAWRHWVAGSLWTASVGFNVVLPRQRFHKHIGRVGGLAFIWLCASACQMIEQGIRVTQLQAQPEGDFWQSVHCAYHSLGNLQAMGFGCWLLGYGIAAAVAKEMEVHRKQMVSMCGFLVLSFLPRVFGACFRWAFPFFTREANYSLGLLFTFLVATKVVLTWKKAKTWGAINLFIFVLSSGLLLALWQHCLSGYATSSLPILFTMLGVYGKRLRILEGGRHEAEKEKEQALEQSKLSAPQSLGSETLNAKKIPNVTGDATVSEVLRHYDPTASYSSTISNASTASLALSDASTASHGPSDASYTSESFSRSSSPESSITVSEAIKELRKEEAPVVSIRNRRLPVRQLVGSTLRHGFTAALCATTLR